MTGAYFLGAFAAFVVACALVAILCLRRCAGILREVRGIASSLRSSRSKIEVHDAELDRVTDALATLRGRFYAERKKSQPDTSNSDSPPAPTGAATSKDEMRRKVGLVAGRPAPHQ